ncbi:MAG TPA: hypothetical protein VGF86_15460 [Candidatus Tumulicola sp.]|jgi:hypothetical protein
MRVLIVVVAVFALLYVFATALDVRRPAAPASPPPQSPSLPAALSDSWGITPAFLKAGPHDVVVSGASVAGDVLTIGPYVTATIAVPYSAGWYQPARMIRFVLENPAAMRSVTLAYPPIAPPSSATAKPDPLSPSNPRAVIVLPKAGGIVALTCTGFGACAVSL